MKDPTDRDELEDDPTEFFDFGVTGENGEQIDLDDHGETKSSWYSMLRSSHPRMRPDQVRGQLDFNASWHEHLTVAFCKMVSAEGVEAWMNILVAIFILFGESMREQDESDVEEPSEEDVGPKQYAGPQ